VSGEARLQAAMTAFAGEFGRRTAIYLESCIRCGHCAEACHFFLATRDAKYTPMWKLEPFRRAWKGKHVTLEELEEWEELLYDSCTMCGRCTAACPMGIDIASLVGQARHGMFAAGLVPPDLMAATERAHREGSPLGATPEVLRDRLDWLADEHQVPLHLDLAQADVMVTFSSVEIMKYPTSLVATARVMEHAGYSWTLSSLGYEATNFGMLSGSAEWQRESSEKVIGAAIACNARVVVLPECGHAYTALRWQGANIHGAPLPFRVLHITEFLDEEIARGRIRVRPQAATVTFHDPCQLSRRGGAAASPRRVLAALGMELREAEGSSDLSFCCGGGGGVIANKRADGLRRRAFQVKMQQMEATGAEVALTSCANCRLSFEDGQAFYAWDRRMGSLLELVADRLERHPPQP
jgi:Fe-S oxidoreductase